MSSEAQVILDIWEVVRDNVPHGKRPAIAEDILQAFQDYGFEAGDCASIIDEDPDMASAFATVFADEDDADEPEDFED
jgi:hypothetical protein